MSERLSRERIEEIRVCANMRKCPLGPPCPVPAEHCDAPTMLQDALSHIAALEAEVERLRHALLGIVGLPDVHAKELEIAVDALAALDGEATDE